MADGAARLEDAYDGLGRRGVWPRKVRPELPREGASGGAGGLLDLRGRGLVRHERGDARDRGQVACADPDRLRERHALGEHAPLFEVLLEVHDFSVDDRSGVVGGHVLQARHQSVGFVARDVLGAAAADLVYADRAR
jgi:hypothetical protein